MSLINAVHFDKRLIDHLGKGGSVEDEVGQELISLIISESLKNNVMKAAVDAAGLSQLDLEIVYERVVSELFPDVFISHGGRPIIVASLPFIDKANFPSFIRAICFGVDNSNVLNLPSNPNPVSENDSIFNLGSFPTDVGRRYKIGENYVAFCEELWRAAGTAGKQKDLNWAAEQVKGYSELPDPRNAKGCGGCLGILTLLFLAGFGMSMMLLSRLIFY